MEDWAYVADTLQAFDTIRRDAIIGCCSGLNMMNYIEMIYDNCKTSDVKG